MVGTQEPRRPKVYCDECKGIRNHTVKAQHRIVEEDEDAGISFTQVYEILQCDGCERVSMLKRTNFSEDFTYATNPVTGEAICEFDWNEEQYPAPSYRREPDWLGELEDDVLTDIMSQVYKSLCVGSNFLAAVGTRTALDRAINLKVGDVRNFPEGWKKLKEIGAISDHEIEILNVTVQAGHAAAHRGHAPNDEDMSVILDTAENLLRRFFILEADAKRLSKSIPSRKSSNGGLRKPTRRKSSRRRFLHELGLPIGAELTFSKDPTVKATVHDDRHVMFRGEPHSLSSAALVALREKDYNWNTVNGWAYWCHDGQTLSALISSAGSRKQ